MKHLLILASARRDLTDIAYYIEENGGGPEATERFIDGMIGKCEQLADLGGTLGTDRGNLRPGLRSTPHGNYIIFFRYTDEAFEIVNVLRASRDVTRFYDAD